MSEELKDASLQLPRAMMYATFGNGILGIAMMITFCFCITDLNIVVGDRASAYPVINVVNNATSSRAATCVLGALLVVLLYFSTVTTVASASRQVWAFSRDQVSLNSTQILASLEMLTRNVGIPVFHMDQESSSKLGNSTERSMCSLLMLDFDDPWTDCA